MPSEFEYYDYHRSFQILLAQDGGIGLVILSYQKMEIWERKISGHGFVGWTMQKRIELGVILGLGRMGGWENLILAYDEHLQFIFIRTVNGVFMIHLEIMQFKNLGIDRFDGIIHTYNAFCTAGARRFDGILAMNDIVSADDSMGAAGDNAAAASSRTAPEEGMVDDKNLESVWNHGQRIGVGSKSGPSGYSKRTKKDGEVTRLKERHHNLTACFGVRPKIRKFMRISLNKEQRKTVSRNRRARKAKTTLRSMTLLYEKKATSKLGKAWAKWFRSNGIPGTKADCPFLCRAIELTQQLGDGELVPVGAEIDAPYLDSSEEETE
ncbi:hypothetical protein BS78_07G121200 [Paspalum vaginatum]|nr:hypothetical protein BS78_07G121200 [Paspalum vaginatum]